MKIVVAGATGFVGDGIVNNLRSAGHELIAIVHSPRSGEDLRANHPEITQVIADVSDDAAIRSVEGAFAGSDTLVYLPGLLRQFPKQGRTFQKVHVEGVRTLLASATRSGISRWVQMSALGTRANAVTEYFKTKWQAEELVRASALDWTILRPSIVFGTTPTKKISFVNEIAKVTRTAPLLPIFGDGNYRMQPIALEVVADAVAKALNQKETIHQSYDLGGPEKIAYEEIMRLISRAEGKNKPVVHIPFGLVEFMASLLDRFAVFPFTRDQLTMLKEENIVHDPAREREFNEIFHPRKITFLEGLQGSLP